jgi:N-acetylmuramic acid 6-phosphate etherase
METRLPSDAPRPAHLDTEARSEQTLDIDRVTIGDGLALLAHEFRHAFDAVERSAAKLAPVVDAVVRCIRGGGSVHLFGAGTSGRMAALDAAEIPPTFGLPPTVFRPHLAGGEPALTTAVEGAEDDTVEGSRAGTQAQTGDVAIGVTASGRTPYVLAALVAARARGAYTALIECNGSGPSDVDCRITLRTGAEPIAGSTRLNAATAQKLALNAVSTLAMVHLGRTYSNLMVCLQPSNAKLRARQARMLRDISGASTGEVDSALAEAENEGGLALVMLTRNWDVERARAALDREVPLRAIVDGDDAGDAPTVRPDGRTRTS